MLICQCLAVNEQTVRATILAGARDAEDLTRRCGAGGDCGGCIPALVDLLEEMTDRHRGARTSAA